jgi:hypothetical protein
MKGLPSAFFRRLGLGYSMGDIIERLEKLQTEFLRSDFNSKEEFLENEVLKLQEFYDYFSQLYGQGLEIANWHQNGDLEPFDNFFDSAEEEMNK